MRVCFAMEMLWIATDSCRLVLLRIGPNRERGVFTSIVNTPLGSDNISVKPFRKL
jgi:hypothetical protein